MNPAQSSHSVTYSTYYENHSCILICLGPPLKNWTCWGMSIYLQYICCETPHPLKFEWEHHNVCHSVVQFHSLMNFQELFHNISSPIHWFETFSAHITTILPSCSALGGAHLLNATHRSCAVAQSQVTRISASKLTTSLSSTDFNIVSSSFIVGCTRETICHIQFL